MRNLISVFLCLFSFSSFAQNELPNNFSVDSYVEVFSNDSIKIYFSCIGTVMDKRCASYYRVGKMDTTIINVVGAFSDYYLSGNPALKATMQNNKLEGPATYYYNNGQIKETGDYNGNQRVGKWTYYYPNGKVEKVLDFVGEEPLVMEAYSQTGEALVQNGNGMFKTKFSKTALCDPFLTWGEVKNGKRVGNWEFGNPNSNVSLATETYGEGVFVKGIANGKEYDDNPVTSLRMFSPHEKVYLVDNDIRCPGAATTFFLYKNHLLHQVFYPELLQELNKYTLKLKDQWLVIGITISKKDKLKLVNIASSIDDKMLESYFYNTLLKMNKWEAPHVNGKKTETNLFFTVLVDQGQIIIPTEYLSHSIRN